MSGGIRTYYASELGEAMLELHDEHTLWKVRGDIEDEDYGLIVEDLCGAFQGETGVQVGCFGRSGRHVCIPDTPMNRLNYGRYRKLALAMEAECVRLADEFAEADRD